MIQLQIGGKRPAATAFANDLLERGNISSIMIGNASSIMQAARQSINPDH
jgi:hypothetical protein